MNGVTDDNPAFAAAIAAGCKKILVPGGRCSVGAGLFLATDGVEIVGVGAPEYNSATDAWGTTGTRIIGKVVLQADGNTVKDLAISNPSGDCLLSWGTNSTVNNVTSVGGSAANPNHCFSFEGGSKHQITNIRGYHNVHGIAIRASDVTATNIYMEDCGGEGLIVKAAINENNKNITVSNLVVRTLHAATTRGIQIQIGPEVTAGSSGSLRNVVINGFAIDSVGEQGIYIVNSSGDSLRPRMNNISLSNGTITRVGSNGFGSFLAANVTLSSVNVFKSGGNGFSTWLCRNVTFSNCSADSVAYYGYTDIAGSDSVYIRGSMVKATGGGIINPASSFSSWNINEKIYVSQPYLLVPGVASVDSGGLQDVGNLRFIGAENRAEGVGPSITWKLSIHPGSATAQYTQAQIVGAPDNSSDNNANGQLRFRVCSYDGIGWALRNSLIVRPFSVETPTGIDLNIGGNATIAGSVNASNVINGIFITHAFTAAIRDAISVPGTLSTDSWQVSWQPATEVGTPGGGRVWATAKTDSVIVRCDSVCSTQFTISRMK
jgi:hypothetical protein